MSNSDDGSSGIANTAAPAAALLMAPTPTTYITDEVETRMLEAAVNGIYNVKRSLLDFVELQEHSLRVHGEMTESLHGFCELMRKRIHNDVSQLEYVIQAVIGMAKRGGDIPRFGRSQDQIDATERKKRERAKQ